MNNRVTDNRTFTINEPQVVADIIDGEVLAINMASGAYFNFQGWSAFVWSHLVSGASVADITETLSVHAGDIEAGTVEAFADELVGHGLVAAADPKAHPPAATPPAATPPAATTPPPPVPFTGLAVEAHTDMADLILLDPVHDVDPNHGWPQPPPPA